MKKTETNDRRWVIKIGSSLITSGDGGLNHAAIRSWAAQVATLKHAGKQIVLVSSGSVAEGMRRLGWKRRPQRLHRIQAAAATGQMGLIHAYESEFSQHGLHAAQVLLTHEDLSSRTRYLNARSTLTTLLDLDVIPVVNENDAVATEEIQLGDNDTLAALTANLIDADKLLILTDCDGLYDADPTRTPNARLIEGANVGDPQLDRAAGPSSGTLGRGGMVTKVAAARRAALSGTETVIASGQTEQVIARVMRGETLGTRLHTDKQSSAARKQWIAALKPCGSLTLDAGACNALAKGGNSLLPIGITAIAGAFDRGDPVTCCNPDGKVIAHGLTNYTTDEARTIIGRHSEEVQKIMGAGYEPEVIHCDNLMVVAMS